MFGAGAFFVFLAVDVVAAAAVVVFEDFVFGGSVASEALVAAADFRLGFQPSRRVWTNPGRRALAAGLVMDAVFGGLVFDEEDLLVEDLRLGEELDFRSAMGRS